MKIETENCQITLTADEALSLCKILGSLCPDDIIKLKGVGYICGDKEVKISHDIFHSLSNVLLANKSYKEVFDDNKQVK
jgi:rhamnose utilization protein RhaD (predicted bifunctional aldolase and dehydrogenase)